MLPPASHGAEGQAVVSDGCYLKGDTFECKRKTSVTKAWAFSVWKLEESTEQRSPAFVAPGTGAPLRSDA